MHYFGHVRKAFVIGTTLAITLGGSALSPIAAHAITQETEAQLTETQKQLEDSAASYETAMRNVEELQAQIDENAARIAELEAQLPEQQEKASAAMRGMYKSNQGSNPFMSFFFQSETLDDLITKMVYMDQIQSSNTNALEKLNATQEELEQQKIELDQAKAQADIEAQKAEKALDEAQRLREEAQRQADEEAAAELALLQQASQESGNGPLAEADSPNINWDVDEAGFVAEWAPRIDAYLAGSPLEGQGSTFASAAWKYGVDPRWSPAISNTESSKGRHCFRQYNAWGWGQIDFNSWEEAIDTHVRGLARGYGYTISVEAAKKYCPPNWYHWYNTTLSEMNRI